MAIGDEETLPDFDAKATAAEIDRIMVAVGPLVRGAESHLAAAMALTLLAAHHVAHDGGSEEDLLAIARTSWAKALQSRTLPAPPGG